MAQHKIVLRQAHQQRLGIEADVEQGGGARDFIPDQKAVDRQTVARRGEHAELAPDRQVGDHRQPASGNTRQLLRVQADQFSQGLEIDLQSADLTGFFERDQFRLGNARRCRRRTGRHAAHGASLANDVAEMIFKLHGATVTDNPSKQQAASGWNIFHPPNLGRSNWTL